MSVVYKDHNGNIVKVAGHMTKRFNARWFLCTRTYEDGVEIYDLSEEDTKEYFNVISPFTIYALGFKDVNTTTEPKLRYKGRVYDIMDLTSGQPEAVQLGQLKGIFQMFTQESDEEATLYFMGDLHKDFGVIEATATSVDGDPSAPAEVDVTVERKVEGSVLDFTFTNVKGATGERGPQGDQGPKGDQGIQGVQGLTALSYAEEVGEKYEDQETAELTTTDFNRKPTVGETVYVLCADRYLTLFRVEAVTNEISTVKALHNSDLLGPQGPQGIPGSSPSVMIEHIQYNGEELPVEDKTVKIVGPTKVSELTNDLKFATEDFVNSSITAQAARLITHTPDADDIWESLEALKTADKYYHGDEEVTPTENDYAIYKKKVAGSELTEQWRAVYENNDWVTAFKVGSVLTAKEQAALDSGATAELIAQITTNKNNITKNTNNFANYLPLAGKKTMTGVVDFNTAKFLTAHNSTGTVADVLGYDNTSNNLLLGSTNWNQLIVHNAIVPISTKAGALDLGADAARFKSLYLAGDIRTNGSVYKGTVKIEWPTKAGTLALTSDVSAEAQNRTDAINAEAKAREDADSTLQANIDKKVAKAGDTMTGELKLPTLSFTGMTGSNARSYTKVCIEHGHLNWSSEAEGKPQLVSLETLAYWNGRYNSSTSNLEYCKGGTIATTTDVANETSARETAVSNLSSTVTTLDAQNVKLTGNQTISGTKNFKGTFQVNGGTITYNNGTFTI